MVLFAPDGRWLEVNRALCEMSGRTREELLSMPARDFTHPDDRAALFDYVKPLLAGELESHRTEKRYLHADGHVVHALLNVSLARDEEGAPVAFIAQVEDITQRKLAEERLARSQAQLAEAQRVAGLGSWEWDLETDVLTWSAELYRIFGVAPEAVEPTYQEYMELVQPDDRERLSRSIERARDEHSPFSLDHRIIRPDGEVRVLHCRTEIGPRPDGGLANLHGTAQDVTDRRRTEDALREAEERFRRAFEDAPVAMAMIALDGRLLRVNRAACELAGYDAEQLLTKTIGGLTHPEDVDKDIAQIRQVLAGERRSYRVEKRYIAAGGREVWGLASLSLVRDQTGAPGYFIVQMQDITERKRAEEALTLSQARLSEAQQIARIGSWEWDLRTGEMTLSDELHRIAGIDPEGFGGTYEATLARVHPEDRPRVDREIREAVVEGRPWSVEARSVHDSGDVRVMHSRGQVEVGDDGQPVRAFGTVQDVTERLRAEQALRESEQRLKGVLENVPSVVFLRDLEGRYLLVNRRWEEYWGLTADEVVGRAPEELFPPELASLMRRNERRVLEARRPLTADEVLERDGEARTFLTTRFLLTDDTGEPYATACIATDITERVRAQEERERMEERLHQAQRLESVGQLAGGIAHDFNNLLAVILNYADFVRDEVADGAAARDVEEIQRAAERAAALTKQLLLFSRRDLERPEVLRPNGVVRDVERLLKRTLGEHVELRTELATGWPVRVDRGQMEQVLVNLAVNARDAMPGGGTLTIGTEDVEITDAAARSQPELSPGRYVRLTVSDTGQGMSQEVADRAFEPFFTTKPHGRGTGLGLATVYGTVKAAGGHVEIESARGRGTVVRAHLPAVDSEAPRAPGTTERGDHAGAGETVLVVEDERGVREVARRILESRGYTVLVAQDGEEAVEIAGSGDHRIDVLLTDLIMPRMAGREVADRVRARHPRAAVVFMSGYTDDVLVSHGALEGAVNFLRKPFTAAGLVAAVQDALAAVPR